jgi:hypothetical protein
MTTFIPSDGLWFSDYAGDGYTNQGLVGSATLKLPEASINTLRELFFIGRDDVISLNPNIEFDVILEDDEEKTRDVFYSETIALSNFGSDIAVIRYKATGKHNADAYCRGEFLIPKKVFQYKGSVPVCSYCGSKAVVQDCNQMFNHDTGEWEINTEFDNCDCLTCGGQDIRLDEVNEAPTITVMLHAFTEEDGNLTHCDMEETDKIKGYTVFLKHTNAEGIQIADENGWDDLEQDFHITSGVDRETALKRARIKADDLAQGIYEVQEY